MVDCGECRRQTGSGERLEGLEPHRVATRAQPAHERLAHPRALQPGRELHPFVAPEELTEGQSCFLCFPREGSLGEGALSEQSLDPPFSPHLDPLPGAADPDVD